MELQELEASIESQLRTGDAGDPEYWGAVLKRLHVRLLLSNQTAQMKSLR